MSSGEGVDLRVAVEAVVRAGLTVTNRKGGYLIRHDGAWLHQTAFRSSDKYQTAGEAVAALMREAAVEERFG